MAKIYRRDNLVSGVTPKKKNEKNRKRSVIVNFRVTPEEKQLIDERIAARKNKDFARADEIRDELEVKGIILEDSRDGVHWKRK